MATALELLRNEINHPNNQDVPLSSIKDTFNDYIAALETEVSSKILLTTLSAAEIAARWHSDGPAGLIEWPDITEDDICVACWEAENTLDHDCSLSNLIGYTSEASAADVYDNGENLAPALAKNDNTHTISLSLDILSNIISTYQLKSGNSAYVVISGLSPPDTGSITVAFAKLA